MESKRIVQGGSPGDCVDVPRASLSFREQLQAEQRGGSVINAGTLFRRFRRQPGAIVKLAAMTFLLFPAGCWFEDLLNPEDQDPVIEVAVLYWARVRTADGTPVAGQLVNFIAFRMTWGPHDDASDDATQVRRTASTSMDGRTYLDCRFLLGKMQQIALYANNTATDPLYDPKSVEQTITYDEAVAQNVAQGGKGLASFERTADFTQ
jgi:hypothetical protein